MKILVIHASAGAGHTKAAEALFSHLKETTSFDVKIADSLEYSSWIYQKAYRQGYAFLVGRVPWLWGLLFGLADAPALSCLSKFLQRVGNNIHAKPLKKFLIAEKFDYIFSTHFLANEIAGYLKKRGMIHSQIVSIVTDYDVHRIWLADGIDYYTVACDYTKERLIKLGVREVKIVVSGIPTDKKFSRPVDNHELRIKLQIKEGVFTVLIATGSFGIGPIEQVINRLRGYQILVVCGRNKKLFHKLVQKNMELVKVCALVSNMDELMSAADVMITKPGGLSISEALVKGLPLVFFSAIPGQEAHNARILKSYGIGFTGKSIDDIHAEIKKLSSSKDYYALMQKNIAQLARPSAINEIARLIP